MTARTAACRRGSTRRIAVRILVGGDPDPAVRLLRLGDRRGGQVRQLLVVRVLEEELVSPGISSRTSGCAPRRMTALPAASISGAASSVEPIGDRLAPLDVEAVIDQKIRPSGDHRIAQQRRTSRGKDNCRSIPFSD